MPYMRVKRKMASASYPDLSVEQPKVVMSRGGKITPSSVPVYDMKLIRNKANDIYGVKQIKRTDDVITVMKEIGKIKNQKSYAVTLLLSSSNTIQDVIEHDKDIYNNDNERAEYLKKVICSVPVGAIICLYNEDLSYDSSKIQFLKEYFQAIGVVLLDVSLYDGYSFISEAENQNLAHGGKIKANGVEAYPDLSVMPPKMVMDDNSLSKLDRLEMVKVDKFDMTEISDTLTVDNWKRASDIFWHYWDKNKIAAVEQLAVMYLDKDGKIIGLYTHSWGGRAATIIEPTIIIASALNLKAQAIMICHNHPSGNLQPSQADIRGANELYKGCSYVGIQLVDSIIIVPDGDNFTSLSLESYVRFAKGGKIENVLTIEVTTIAPDTHKILVDGRLWAKPKKDSSDIGEKLINVLYYSNKNADKNIKVFIDGVDETHNFKQSVISKYTGTYFDYFIDYLGKDKYAKGGKFGYGRLSEKLAENKDIMKEGKITGMQHTLKLPL